jgi:hypothetical protein
MAIEKKRRTVKKRTGRNGKNLNRTQKGGAARAPSAVSGPSAVRSQGAYRAANAVRSQGAASAGRGHSAGIASSRSFHRRFKSNKGPDITYGPENLNSYVILNDSQINDLNFGVIDQILSSKLKLEKHEKGKTTIPTKIFFQWLEDTQDPNDYEIKHRYYNVKTVLLNSLKGLDCISNKQQLNKNMETHYNYTYKEFMMPTKTFTQGDTYESLKEKLGGAEWFIARPLEMKDKGKLMAAAQGVGIEYIKDQGDIEKFKQELLQKTSNGTPQYIITSYILNPLLYKGRKFQLRVFFLAGFINGSKIAYVAGKSRIITAAQNYDKSPEHFNEKAIHDTHFKSTDENAYFPDDFIPVNIFNSDNKKNENTLTDQNRKEKIDSINEQMRKVFSDVAKIFFSDPKCCSQYKLGDSNQADNSYKEFGADIMITDDFQIKLIEINDRPGHNLRDKCVKPKDKGEGEGEGEGIPDCDENFTRYIYEWTMDTVIIPVYNHHHHLESEKKVELYHPEALDRTPVYSDPPIRV